MYGSLKIKRHVSTAATFEKSVIFTWQSLSGDRRFNLYAEMICKIRCGWTDSYKTIAKFICIVYKQQVRKRYQPHTSSLIQKQIKINIKHFNRYKYRNNAIHKIRVRKSLTAFTYNFGIKSKMTRKCEVSHQ